MRYCRVSAEGDLSAADVQVPKGGFMQGEVRKRPEARDAQSQISIPSRLGGSHRGPNDPKVSASAVRNYQRYSALAREASSRGDMVAMENFYQYAEHYFRVMRAASARGK